MSIRLLVTAGEPAGIGPELLVRVAMQSYPCVLVAMADPQQLQNAATQLGLTLKIDSVQADDQNLPLHQAGKIFCISTPLKAPANAGQLNINNAPVVYETLIQASNYCLNGWFSGIVTGPVHKGIINQSGITFTGHTELFAAQAQCDVVMMLVHEKLRIALATTHLPLKSVPAAISTPKLIRIIEILVNDLHEKWRIERPRIAVIGLNPHAGEQGHLGSEEIEIIQPAIHHFKDEPVEVVGPLAADTAFLANNRAHFDAFLAMYHDQGLPVLKALGFGESVNVTLGLPYIRCSVDHGVGLDIAGKGIADEASLISALQTAIKLATHTQPAQKSCIDI